MIRAPARQAAGAMLAALLFGTAMAAGLAPVEAWWFSALCLAGLFHLLRGAGAALRFGAGFAFGAGWFAAGLWWIVPGLLETSQAGWLLALALAGLLVTYGALFGGLAALAAGLAAGRPPWLAALVTAATWMLGEWLRGHLFVGMPMLPTGLVQVSGPLAGYGPLVGVHGIGFLAAFCSAVLARCAPRGRGVFGACRGVLPAACAIAVVMAGGAILGGYEWTARDGRVLDVRLVHTDIGQQGKFDMRAELVRQQEFMRLAITSPAALTVLPETSVSINWDTLPRPLTASWRRAAGDKVLLLGAFGSARARPGWLGDGSNSMFGLGPGVAYRYDKEHLVPVGEALPAWLGWLGSRLSVQYGALLPGAPAQPPLDVRGLRVGVSICYENQFEDHMAGQARFADMLIVASNFAWGRGSHAALQHLQASRMRAIETGRWVMQVSNGGVTALADPAGHVDAALEPGEPGLLDVRVPAMAGLTPFVRFGNAPLLAVCLTLVAVATVPALRRRVAPRPLAFTPPD